MTLREKLDTVYHKERDSLLTFDTPPHARRPTRDPTK